MSISVGLSNSLNNIFEFSLHITRYDHISFHSLSSSRFYLRLGLNKGIKSVGESSLMSSFTRILISVKSIFFKDFTMLLQNITNN